MNENLALLRRLRTASPLDPVISEGDLNDHLAKRSAKVGAKALAEFAHVQRVASEVWGAKETAHFARVLRGARVSSKDPPRCPWEVAERQLAVLPAGWQAPLKEHFAVSKKGKAVLGRTIWSAAYAKSVISALARWVTYCSAEETALLPSASELHNYASCLVGAGSGGSPVTVGTAANYISRILAGLTVAARFHSDACSFVAADWRERAARQAAATKTGSQLVGASAIYRLGFDLMHEARSSRLRGVRAATTFRNGLILAVGSALPERARALSWLEFDRTLTLIDRTHVHVSLPGEALKYPEARKARAGYEVVFENCGLAEALHDYRCNFRPLFDDGLHLFPSFQRKGMAISSQQLGKLTGDMTYRAFGVRISIHRLRDNVATEASECLLRGAYAAQTLMRHVDEATTRRHYDRAQGLKAASEFEEFIENRRTIATELEL